MRRAVVFLACMFAGVALLNAQNMRIGVLNGPSCVPAAKLMDDAGTYQFTQYADPQALLPKLLKKEIDAGFLPSNVAVKVYNSSSKAIVMCAVTGNGNIKLITTDKNVKQFTDLKNVDLYVAGQGAIPDYMTKYMLVQNMVPTKKPEGAELLYSIPNAQIAAQMISGKINYAVVPEPFATIGQMKSKDVRAAVDYAKEYKLMNGKDAEFPMTVLVARREFAEENPELLESFIENYSQSYKWTIKNPVQAGSLCEKANLGLNAAVVAKAIPKSNYAFVRALDARSNLEDFLKILLEFSPESIGGKLPESDFYYSNTKNAKKNP